MKLKHLLIILIGIIILTVTTSIRNNIAEAITIDELPPIEPTKDEIIRNLMSDITQENIDQFITIKAEEYGVYEKRFRDIISCESAYKHLAKNPNSSARGIMQIMISSVPDFKKALSRYVEVENFDRFNPYQSIEASLAIIKDEAKYANSKRGGWYRWSECW